MRLNESKEDCRTQTLEGPGVSASLTRALLATIIVEKEKDRVLAKGPGPQRVVKMIDRAPVVKRKKIWSANKGTPTHALQGGINDEISEARGGTSHWHVTIPFL